MKQTIEIEVPEGKSAVWKDGRVIFKDINPLLPKTWKEFCENHDTKMGERYTDDRCNLQVAIGGYKRDAQKDRNLLPSKQAAEAHLALMQLHQLRDCYRDGWQPNLKDDSDKYGIERLYNPVLRNIELRVAWHNDVSIFLSFPTCELANEFLTNFRELIEQAGDLI